MPIKNKKSIVCGVLAACVLAAVCLTVFLCRANFAPAPHETKPLVDVLDSANMMLVIPEGLGDRVKGRVVKGRAYQNFAQMLRFADAKESLQDTFYTHCPVGLRIQLFRDTLSVAELRIAENIGRVGEDVGVWTPEDRAMMDKIYSFIWRQGVNFRACGVRGVIDASEYAFSRMILDADTAVGTPLYEVLKGANRATVFKPTFIPQSEINSFIKASNAGENVKIKKVAEMNVELDSSQFQEFLSLVRDTKRESYAGHCLCKSHMTITLYHDSTAIMALKVISRDFSRFEKDQLETDFGKGGSWEPANPKAMEAFLTRVMQQKKSSASDVSDAH